MRTSAYLLLGSFLVLAAAAAHAGDWAQWRGPEQTGVSREKGLVEEWSLEGMKNVLWVSPIGGRAAPVMMNGRVYLNCRTSDDINDPQQLINAGEQVVCWDAATGEIVWQDRFNVFQTDIPAPRVGWASMAGDPETGNVYLHSVDGLFRCYTGDGKVVWEYSLFEQYGKISGYGGRTMTPIIDEDRVIVSFLTLNWGKTGVPPPKHTYYAFDKRTGKLLWVSAPGGRPLDTNYSCPVVAVIDGTRMLIGGNGDGGVYAINARTGEPLWGFMMSKRGLNTTPVVDGNYVYMAHGEDNIDSIAFGRIECIDATGRGDVTKTHSVWRVDEIKAGYSGLLVHDGILYVVADTGNMHAFDSRTGEPLWIHKLGTVGKGSPVWADGKIYVMEVNGNIHILQPSRQECRSLCHVALRAADGVGMDEIYASPAIADGRIVFVTRDRTICVGTKDHQPSSDPVPPLPAETAPQAEIALLQLVPYEAHVSGGGEVEYELHAFDQNGRFLKKLEPALEPQADLPDAKVAGNKLVFGEDATEQGGHVSAKFGDLTATARVRVLPKLPWKWDFEGLTGSQVPPTWIGATRRLVPVQEDGSTVLQHTPGGGTPSVYIWLGSPDMTGYTIQADALMREEKRRLPSVGLTVCRYNLILKGNNAKLGFQDWAPHPRIGNEVRFRSDPNVWYTLKMRVDIRQDGAYLYGKAWKRTDPEPEAWTVEAVDPNPNVQGSPGLYMYSLAPCLFDNVSVSQN
jgi:outer membrane protein assembly factor BamB